MNPAKDRECRCHTEPVKDEHGEESQMQMSY